MREQLVTTNPLTNGGTNPVHGITVHETGNTSKGANAAAHANLQTRGNNRKASWHITVDDTEAVRSYPDTAQCWHAGHREANNTHLAVEICVNIDGNYEAAFKRAAKTVQELRAKYGLGRDQIKQHHDWTGKDCPSRMRLAGRWQEFLALTDPPKENQPMGRMVSPFEGRLTQNHWRSGGYTGHKGMDIAPPLPGQTGRPVRAMFDGTVKRVYRSAKPGNKNSTWAPGRTGNGVLVANPDGEGNGYNHMAPVAGLKVGDKVKAGQVIGHNDRSGNQTGPHLHLELWVNWRDPYSDYDPQLAFRKFGVTPGAAADTSQGAASKPAGKPKPPKDTNSKADNVAIQKALAAMGLDVGYPDGENGPKQKAGVAAFQRQHGLVDDGYWGPKTQAMYEHNKRLQTALNKMKRSPGVAKVTVDGWIGRPSTRLKNDVLARNGWTSDNLIQNLQRVGAW